MPASKHALVRILAAIYAVFWIGGIVSHALPTSVPAPAWASPLFLLLAASLTTLTATERGPLLLFAAGGFIAEVIGVDTGLPFGRYTYTSTLGPAVAGVPLAIAAAWLILLAFARDTAARLTQSRALATLLGAAIMTASDLLIDPIATNLLNFWHWTQPGPWYGVPTINFAGWFATSALLLALTGRPRTTSTGPRLIGATILAFFTLILLTTRF
jgi:putative membrane protein